LNAQNVDIKTFIEKINTSHFVVGVIILGIGGLK